MSDVRKRNKWLYMGFTDLDGPETLAYLPLDTRWVLEQEHTPLVQHIETSSTTRKKYISFLTVEPFDLFLVKLLRPWIWYSRDKVVTQAVWHGLNRSCHCGTPSIFVDVTTWLHWGQDGRNPIHSTFLRRLPSLTLSHSHSYPPRSWWRFFGLSSRGR